MYIFCCHDRSHRSPAKSVLPLNAAACFVVATYEMMKKDNIIIILLLMLGEDIIGVGCWRLHRSASHTQLWVGGDRRWSLRILTTIPKSDPTPIPQLFCLSPLQISPSAKHLSPLKRLTRESSVDLSPPKSRLAKILYPPGGQFDLFHLYWDLLNTACCVIETSSKPMYPHCAVYQHWSASLLGS